MSPRRRSRNRHGGAAGSGPGGAASAVAPDGQPGVAADPTGQPVELPAVEGTRAQGNGVAHVNGSRPDGGSGNQAEGQPRGPRRQPRGRPEGRAAGFGPRGARAPGPAVAATQVVALVGEAPVVPMPPIAAPAFDEDGNPIPGHHHNCTLAQMRRFIKSRPYVPVHELRRRFEIEGIEDEVSPVATGNGTVFVGLPAEQAGFLGELIRSGDIGCEMLLDPASPGVVGVFPMRPVARQ